jgi:Fe-S cluster biogenesis protein NfuA
VAAAGPDQPGQNTLTQDALTQDALTQDTLTQDALSHGVACVDRALRAHRGGAELVERRADGEVVLRLTGMCTGCLFWPATLAGTIKPLLEHSVGGPVPVSIEGRRVSAAAMARLARLAPSLQLTEHLTR